MKLENIFQYDIIKLLAKPNILKERKGLYMDIKKTIDNALDKTDLDEKLVDKAKDTIQKSQLDDKVKQGAEKVIDTVKNAIDK